MKLDIVEKMGISAGIVYVLVMCASIYGWVHNIIMLAHMSADPITTMFVLRCIGIIVAPLGIIMGYIS